MVKFNWDMKDALAKIAVRKPKATGTPRSSHAIHAQHSTARWIKNSPVFDTNKSKIDLITGLPLVPKWSTVPNALLMAAKQLQLTGARG